MKWRKSIKKKCFDRESYRTDHERATQSLKERKKSEKTNRIRSRESRQREKTIRRHLNLNSSFDWNIHNIRLSNYSRELERTFCALSCALLLLSLAISLLSHCSFLLSHCSLTASFAPLLLLLLSLAAPSRACLKRSCSRSQPKAEADDARIGVYIIYI
jgi:hypothetical protein